ncbi:MULTISPECIES: hypothetical protein [unclassified Microcoleus]|uniref:hypothetical protein n=1 Tax=unclassified Microcoleus TaxID=2642155 RepID=UPI0025F567D4|nr:MULTISPECIES: hypothetical protein [unclassified Microcoleus]
MKVIQKTRHLLELSNRLELKNNAIVFLTSYFFTFGLPTLGLFLLIPVGIVDAGVERFSCKKVERTIATCELTTSTFVGLVKGKLTSIEGVKGSRVDKITDTDMEEVFLVTNQGDVPLPNQTGDDVRLFNKYIQTAVGEIVI